MMDFQLKSYYTHLFPFDKFFEWLRYDHELERGKHPRHREFSFTLDNGTFYREHLPIVDKEELKKWLFEKIPTKIDIGAEYDIEQDDKCNILNKPPFRKEICIDIDISDYNNVRTCCEESNICNKCWKYMILACKILDSIFRVELCYKHILWVFSGRRGIHCWICDPEVRSFDGRYREAITGFLKSLHLQPKIYKFSELPPMHKRVMEMIDNAFVEICIIDQKLLSKKEDIDTFIGYLPDENIRIRFKNEMLKYETSEDRWNAFVSLYEQLKETNGLPEDMKGFFVSHLKTIYTYPRLDIEVTRSFSHLLKAPFCVHPKTGNICVPINPQLIHQFDIDNVPTIENMINQIEGYKNPKIELLPYVQLFETFVSNFKNK